MTQKCKDWLRAHSSVEACNVASVRQQLSDITLGLEVQAFVHGTLSKAMCEIPPESLVKFQCCDGVKFHSSNCPVVR